MIRSIARKTAYTFFPALLWKTKASSQNDNQESRSLVKYAEKLQVDKSFVEFGFHPLEFNSVGLTNLNYKGLLLDSDRENCERVNGIFQSMKLNTRAVPEWITLNTLGAITNFVKENHNRLGVLNVDIDGNDYWVLGELLKSFKPDIICVEYNASLGLRPLTIPYSDDFDRHKHHSSGWYFGASITAFSKLLAPEYSLVENVAGLNLIYVRSDKMTSDMKALVPEEAYSEGVLTNKWSSTNADFQWKTIKDLPFVSV